MAKERKLKAINKSKKEALEAIKKEEERLKEIEELREQALKEETELLKSTEERIKEICEEVDLFCGFILNVEILKDLIDLMVKSGENIKIPFGLYFKEKLED